MNMVGTWGQLGEGLELVVELAFCLKMVMSATMNLWVSHSDRHAGDWLSAGGVRSSTTGQVVWPQGKEFMVTIAERTCQKWFAWLKSGNLIWKTKKDMERHQRLRMKN
ncbi:hypothetical protein LAZ67_13000595 [Cordylochernes scorpioides]|uniref:Uncharacterized protein n=1 Tax=Cordylochernes scorpioides TaxID=51811 RepID=A0ABY6L5J1_9ARAC|nr:hypothetical protein LAZ67_13000595 [Cordylochernes scorpioides]